MSTQLERWKRLLLNDILEVHSSQLEGTLKSILNFENLWKFIYKFLWWRNYQIQEMSTQLERCKWVLLNDILEVHSNQLEGILKSILNFENF